MVDPRRLRGPRFNQPPSLGRGPLRGDGITCDVSSSMRLCTQSGSYEVRFADTRLLTGPAQATVVRCPSAALVLRRARAATRPALVQFASRDRASVLPAFVQGGSRDRALTLPALVQIAPRDPAAVLPALVQLVSRVRAAVLPAAASVVQAWG